MSHATGQDATTGMLGQRVDHYAADHGLQVATVRKRIQRGQLVGYKGADHRWYVVEDAPPSATPGETRDRTGQDTRQDTRQDTTAPVAVNANARAQLEAIRDEWLRPLVETIAQQAERIGHLEATSAAQDETIAALRRRAEAAEAELVRRHEAEARAAELLRRRNEQEWLNRERMQAAQDGSGTPEPLTPDNPSGVPAAGFWARVRRVCGGA